MKITKLEFKAYQSVQESSVTNMFNVNNVCIKCHIKLDGRVKYVI